MPESIIEGFQLSPQQKHLWLLQRGNHSLPYQAQCEILIEGNLNAEVLKAAIENAVNRHEILRTSFRGLPEITIPLQVIAESSELSFQNYNLSDLAPQEQEHRLEVLFDEAKQLTFDFEKNSPLHTSLVKLSPHKHILLVSLPALCADTLTLKNLVSEISCSYAAILHNKELSDEPLQYVDFSELQHELIEGEKAETVREYWRNIDVQALLGTKLPLEGKPSGKPEFQPQFFTEAIASHTKAKIEALVGTYNTSVSGFLLACWQILLWRLTGQSDMIVGMAGDGRSYEELEAALGLFAKYLPIHGHLEENCQFTQILQQVDKSVQDMYEWQDYFSWEQIVGELENGTVPPFSPFSCDFEQAPADYCAANLTFSIYKQYVCIDRFKVKLSGVLADDSLITTFHYDANLFQQEDIKRLAGQFQTLLESALDNPESAIAKLDILSKVERQQLLVEFNNTKTDYPQDKCIHQLFEEQAARTPDKVAVICENQQLTYSALNARANQLAYHLQTLGVGPEVFVGIYMERSLDVVIGILGVLKAGGAYVPLDPAYPKERLTFMAENSQVLVLLTQERLRSDLPEHEGQVVLLDTDWSLIAQQSEANLSRSASPLNLAYVIYTSGSTGEPKGVMVTHANLCNYVQVLPERVGITPDDLYLHTASIAFSSSVRQFMIPLCQGATVLIATLEQRANPLMLFDAVKQHGVTVMDIVPSYWRTCIQALATLDSTSRQALLTNQLRLILSASEPLMSDIPRTWTFEFNHAARLVNMYGQTETTGIISIYDIPPQSDDRVEVVHLGPPLPNSQIHVLDQHQQVVPIGVPGELHIGGASIARGYLNRPELTAKAFIPNPFNDEPEARLYKTGDLVRYLPDGTIEFVSRIDDQVKIRGFRIELGEIQAVLAQHPAMREALVIVREDVPGDKMLVAYLIPQQEPAFTIRDLRHFLKEKLPNYMIPSAFVMLEALPLTPNGKVDYRALPAPEIAQLELEETFVAPRTPVEKELVSIWANVLKVERLGVHNSFFDLGGHSLLAMQVMSRLRQAFGVELPVLSLFEAPTVAELAEQIDTLLWAKQQNLTAHSSATEDNLEEIEL